MKHLASVISAALLSSMSVIASTTHQGNINSTAASVLSMSTNTQKAQTYYGWSIHYKTDEFGDLDYSIPYLGHIWKGSRNNTFDAELFCETVLPHNFVEFTLVEDVQAVYIPSITLVASYNGQKFTIPTETGNNWIYITDVNSAKKFLNILDSGSGILKLSFSRTDSYGTKKNWVFSISLPTKCKTAWNVLLSR